MTPISIMGILNVTPDSFSDGGLYYDNILSAVKHAETLLAAGADIIDIGGESSRPGAQQITIQEELDRVIPTITAIRKKLGGDFKISIDTYKAEVAKEALSNGASMVNSMGGFRFDPELAAVVAQLNCQLVIYHIKGTPQTMQVGKIEYVDVISEIQKFFEEQIEIGQKAGIAKEQFILDPGIGFGKTVVHNLVIVRRLATFKSLDLPILIGVSRKGHLATILQNKLSLDELPAPLERIEAALAETAMAVINGATIVRTHDVLQTKKFITILEELA